MIHNLQIHWLDARHPNLKRSKIWLHALAQDEIIGQLSVTPIEREWALIGDLFVPARLRGQGIASALIADAEAGARNTAGMKLVGMAARVRRENAACLSVFTGRGYLHCWTFEGGTLLMVKRLGARKES